MNKKYAFLLMLLLPLLWACSSEDSTLQDAASRHRHMIFDGQVVGFVPATRAASVSVPQGAVMYLQLGSVATTASYDGGEWTVTLPDNLSDNASGTCTAYYFESPSISGTQVSLSSSRPLFKGTGTFSNTQEAFKLVTTLRPMTMRLHFRGTPGTRISVTGIEGYNSFDASSHKLTYGALPASLTVQQDGYTTYVHGMLTSNRTLKVSDGTYTYTRTFSSSVMREGESGWLDIPTPTSHVGWTSDEQTDADLSGGDYGGETDWNQPDKEPTTDADLSGGDYGSESDWNLTDQPTDGHAYVDLGLSVKWATCNVGASSAEEYGDYYAWGETATKSSYGWSTYKWCNGSNTTMTKYCTSSSCGTVDNKTTLESSDDVAHVKWGGSWRMPTDDEFAELINTSNCTWTWTTQGGNNGYKVTSKKNGNSIFLPAAGYRFDGSLNDTGSYGSYWSSSLGTIFSNEAYVLDFNSGNVSRYDGDRYYGQSVRPVCP